MNLLARVAHEILLRRNNNEVSFLSNFVGSYGPNPRDYFLFHDQLSSECVFIHESLGLDYLVGFYDHEWELLALWE